MVPDVWGVVATANAPLLDIARFCAHHLYEGAEVIFIYLDDPDVEVNAALETLPQIKVIPTDNAYWSSKGARPENIEQRQSRNARDAARKMKAQFPHLKWLGHLDIDEFITMAPTVKNGTPSCNATSGLPVRADYAYGKSHSRRTWLLWSRAIQISQTPSPRTASNIENYFP